MVLRKFHGTKSPKHFPFIQFIPSNITKITNFVTKGRPPADAGGQKPYEYQEALSSDQTAYSCMRERMMTVSPAAYLTSPSGVSLQPTRV